MKETSFAVFAFIFCSTLLLAEKNPKWDTVGFQQANTMGSGKAKIDSKGVFRVFLLMGQSNMAGAARAKKLSPPYTEKHDRIRVWANGRWEYFVPSHRFGPGVSMARQLADFWPNDTIGIIKIASGGSGLRAFEKRWTFERANLTFDGKKGSFYQDLLHAVTEANKISQPQFSGFVWNQGGADATKKDLADEYFDTFELLVSDIRKDLNSPTLPVFVLTHSSDEDLRKIMRMMTDGNLPKVVKKALRKRPHLGTVLMAHNRAGREIADTKTVHHGRLPVGKDGIHFNAEGQIQLGKMTASAIEAFYTSKR